VAIPLISIVIPACNAAATIARTLASIEAQTYRKIEVIVVDDGSSDETAVIVEGVAARDPRFRLFRQSNAGVGAARNTAIGHASGKYIAPIDADDLWYPEKLDKQVACMEECGDGTGLVYCWSKWIDQDGNFMGYSHPYTVEGRVRRALILRNFVDSASVPLIRASVLDKVGLYLTRIDQNGAQGCEDWDLYLRIVENFAVRAVPEYLVGYRQTSSCMSLQAGDMVKSFSFVIRRARERNSDLPRSLFRWSSGHFYMYLVYKCYLWGDYSSCLRCLRKAAFSDPVLLLNAAVYRKYVRSMIGVIAGSNGSDPPKAAGRPAEPGAEDVVASARKQRPSLAPSGIYKRIEGARWADVLDGTGKT